MPRDYAKKTPSLADRRSTSTERYRCRWFLWGMLTGVSVCGALYIMPAHVVSHVSETLQKTIEKPVQMVKKKPQEAPQFDFYRMLPQMGSEPEHADSTQAVADTPPALTSTDKAIYLLQVASFTKHSEAERMKAQLLLAGFEVDIQLFEQGHEKWYRVIIGPFNDQPLARKQQQILKQQAIDSLLLTQHVAGN